MIPKIIHYSWISDDEYLEDIKHNIESWKKFLPDYTFMKWDSKTFDFYQCQYIKDAFESKSWAHASDFIRVWAVYNYGGFWLDSDVEVFKSFDDLLKFPYILTKETKYLHNDYVDMGVMGFEPKNPIMKKLLDFYYKKKFIKVDTFSSEIIPQYFRDICNECGIKVEDVSPSFEDDDEINNLRNSMKINASNTIYTLDNFKFFFKDSDKAYAQHYLKGSWLK